MKKEQETFSKLSLEELFVTPRMGHVALEPQNSVKGLYDMVKKHFNSHFIMAEIGSFEGVSTLLFSMFVKKIYSIDCYDYHVPESGRIPSMDQMFLEAEKTFEERTKEIQNIIKIKSKSVDAAQHFEKDSLDCVYIDGEHLYDYINADVLAWKDKVKNGGILCGHDYDKHHSQSIYLILSQYGLMNDSFEVYSDTSWSVVIRK